MSAGSDLANTLATSLLTGTDFSVTLPSFSDDEFEIPDLDTAGVDGPVTHLSTDDLTTGVVTGTGTFDRLMVAAKAHLKQEYEGNRISGAEYTKAYIALIEGSMANATQFLLSRDGAYWQAINAQIASQMAKVQLVTARVQLEAEKTKLQTLRIDALTSGINYATGKMRLATESIQFDRAKYELDNLMPQQLAIGVKNLSRLDAEIIGAGKENDLKDKQILLAQGEVDMIAQKSDMLAKQIIGVTAQNTLLGKQASLADKEIALGDQKLALLIKQVASQEAQTQLVTKQVLQVQADLDLQPYKQRYLQEQAETQRSQTLDTRSDGVTVTGSVGKQKELYAQQITSYRRDAEMKAAKVFIDAWTVMKTIDEGLAPPTLFSNTNLDSVLTTIKTNNSL